MSRKANITNFPIKIRLGEESDIDQIVKITRQYPQELGYVRIPSLKEALKRHTLLVADYEQTPCVAFVNYYPRKDGWNTIYEIATHKGFVGRGIGRYLLDAVPCPTRLKCTTDNSANIFYKKSHFKLIRTEEGKKRKLNVWERKFLFIFCKGGSRTAQEVCVDLGVTYGTRHNNRPYIQPFFVDIDWKKYDWLDYLLRIRAWKPVFAMVPDYMDSSQKEDMLQAVNDLKDAGVLRVGVCPKFDGAIKDIPQNCVVCVSYPTRYAGFLPDATELLGREIHLLGGSPKKIRAYLENNKNLKIISWDSNYHSNISRFGGVYMAGNDSRTDTRKLGVDLSYVDTIKLNTQQIYKMLDSID